MRNPEKRSVSRDYNYVVQMSSVADLFNLVANWAYPLSAHGYPQWVAMEIQRVATGMTITGLNVPCMQRSVHMSWLLILQFDQGGVHKEVSVTLKVIMMLTQDPPSPSLKDNLLIRVDCLILSVALLRKHGTFSYFYVWYPEQPWLYTHTHT